MSLSIVFGIAGNINLVYLFAALAGIETIFALFVEYKSENSPKVSTTEFWFFSTLVVLGVGATFIFVFPAGLPLFAPAVVTILDKSKTSEK
ncbi:hypothetical protein ccrud_06900 [Corynebacterium crudilactis]|uniref:Uncharacterized protein n=2 Tax=Corynebacterium crudilactis TaxID=1652495 RepID=A0A172QTD3_9CORY|nr:hypothetical protein ccrud_06900 [Corynebacterium crudilactis]